MSYYLPFAILLLGACTPEISLNEKEETDKDGDGFHAEDDCADFDATIHPDAIEICDGIDQNCNGTIDEGALIWYYVDSDQDGYGNPSTRLEDCSPPQGTVSNATDCNDLNPLVNPMMFELCNFSMAGRWCQRRIDLW